MRAAGLTVPPGAVITVSALHFDDTIGSASATQSSDGLSHGGSSEAGLNVSRTSEIVSPLQQQSTQSGL
jgi:hypothetical protein